MEQRCCQRLQFSALRTRIFEKLGISSRVELVLYAVNNGDPGHAEWLAGTSRILPSA